MVAPDTLVHAWFVLALLLTTTLAALVPVAAWRGYLPLTRLNYFGATIGTALLGLFFLLLVKEGEFYFVGLAIALLGLGFGSLMAIFFSRQPTTGRAPGRWLWILGASLLLLVLLPPIVLKPSSGGMAATKPLPNAELAKIRIDNATLDGVGYVNGSLYNGSGWVVTSLTIRVGIYAEPVTNGDTASKAILSREYTTSAFCKPRTSDNLIVNVGLTLKEHQHWAYKIVQAAGFRDED